MGSPNLVRGRIAVLLAALSLLAMALGGCGVNSPLAPEPASVQYTKDNPPPFLTSPRPPDTFSASAAAPTVWYSVASTWVDAGQDKTVGGSRYELHFRSGSLSQGKQVSIQERDGCVIEFELGPHGTVFGEPVDITIDFAGTNADAGSSNYDGSKPVLYWFNEITGIWEVVPGTLEGLKYHTTLQHFSLYGLAPGKAGW